MPLPTPTSGSHAELTTRRAVARENHIEVSAKGDISCAKSYIISVTEKESEDA